MKKFLKNREMPEKQEGRCFHTVFQAFASDLVVAIKEKGFQSPLENTMKKKRKKLQLGCSDHQPTGIVNSVSFPI